MSKKAMMDAAEGDSEDPAEARALAERFGRLVKKVGGPTRAGELLKVRPNTIHTWIKGTSKIPFYAVLRLSQEADLTLDQFASGEEALATRRDVSATAPAPALGDAFVMVPMLQVTASAGRGRFTTPDDLTGGDMVGFPGVWLRTLGLTPGRTHILWAVGDSMNPTINDGDMLLIDRMIDKVLDDGIYVVVVGGGVVVKRIQLRHNGSVVLKSDNERYDEQIIPPDEVPSLVVEGRVRWCGGPI